MKRREKGREKDRRRVGEPSFWGLLFFVFFLLGEFFSILSSSNPTNDLYVEKEKRREVRKRKKRKGKEGKKKKKKNDL